MTNIKLYLCYTQCAVKCTHKNYFFKLKPMCKTCDFNNKITHTHVYKSLECDLTFNLCYVFGSGQFVADSKIITVHSSIFVTSTT